MSALPARGLHPRRGEERNAKGTPFLKLHRCRLDYNAALRERLRGGCAARVARAAGSRATSLLLRQPASAGFVAVQRPDKRYSLTDCASMNAMDPEGIREILTNDHHFEQDGYAVLIKA